MQLFLRRRKTSERKSQAHGVIIFGAIYLSASCDLLTMPPLVVQLYLTNPSGGKA
jgi:hypothetical protein